MRLRYVIRVMVAAVALGGIYGCSEGDDATINIDAPTTTTTTTTNNTTETPDDSSGGGGSTSTVSENCPDWAGAKRKDDDGNDVCALPAEINESRLLTSDIVWLMEDRVTVGNGNREMSETKGVLADGSDVISATLTIEAGTHIKASGGTFANLVITRGSRIQAEGTANAPIVFSSDDADMSGSGEWGGLIVHGYGEHNQCPAEACNIDAEGESGFAGGYTADDNSGTLRYVVVTEGGYEFAPGDEINGISLVGVGSGTTMQYIQVNDNSDDGIEFYGGAVNVKHIVLTGNLDDSVDWDEGFVGNMQYVLVKQSPSGGGNAIEADTEGAALPLSKPTIANATFVTDSDDETEALVFKAASGGFLHNSVITTAPGFTLLEDCVDVSRATDNANALVFNNIIADCAAEGTGNFYKGGTVKGMESNIHMVEAELDDNYASQAAEAMLDAPIDWADYNAMNSESTADPDYLDATDYLGAVKPDGSDLWYQGWIIENSL